MAVVLLILCLILVLQVLKIIIKTSIIDKNVVDYIVEYIVALLALCSIFFREELPEDVSWKTSIFCVAYEIISLIYTYYKYIKNKKLNNFSIKDVIDSSEIGILVLKGNKKVLTNTTMCNILDSLNIQNDYVSNILKHSKEPRKESFIVKVDEKYYLFSVSKIEIIAFDVTEECKLQNELNGQNEKIAENNHKLIDNIKNIEKYEKEKNLLKLKNKYHDFLGQNLSILQQYLNRKNITKDNFEEIKYMINKMFIEMEDTEDANTNLEKLIKTHQENGTKVIVTGKLPDDKNKSKALFEIIREAVTNAIKHANSTEIYVDIVNEAGTVKVRITNNGKLPIKNITENDGIKGMKRKVAELDGEIYFETVPRFLIKIHL